MIEPGSIVRGNWSAIEYRVNHVGGNDQHWWINAKNRNNPLQSGHFSSLGERVGNTIKITDETRPDGHLIIILEKKPKHPKGQLELDLQHPKLDSQNTLHPLQDRNDSQ